mmetsp:Transcript_13949/g.33456  ORF Transcript_13949/g.33456 Transcript_13949/m.33456 type:complete len:370 (+) Transcript_13949:1572-2681(+)
MAGRLLGGVEGAATEFLSNTCCECWTNGCGVCGNGTFGVCADGLERLNPVMEYIADLIWCLGSPLAFPLVFCFDAPAPEEIDPYNGGWQVSMLESPVRRPLLCCVATSCPHCTQFYLRRQLLDNDMSKYKLWQGMHDGPHCCARRCEGAPITIKSGTYGESNCPNTFLAMEVCCLGGLWSLCCSFGVNRRLIKQRHAYLKDDPTEIRVNKCIGFFSMLASKLCMLGCCVCITSRCIGCCASGSESAQECSSEGARAGNACRSCARTCWRGIWSVKFIAMGCMSSQIEVELKEGGTPRPFPPGVVYKPKVKPPVKQTMKDRGVGSDGDKSTSRARGGPVTLDVDNNDATNRTVDEGDDEWWNEKPEHMRY